MVILILHIMYSQWSSLGFYYGMVGWTPAAPVSHPILTNSLDLEYGTVGMDGCCAPDVILQSLHLVCNSSVAVNLDSHVFEA